MAPAHTIPSSLSKIHFNIVHPPCLSLPSGFFPSGFPTNILYAFKQDKQFLKSHLHVEVITLNFRSKLSVGVIGEFVLPTTAERV
jgi:hypothetical protein